MTIPRSKTLKLLVQPLSRRRHRHQHRLPAVPVFVQSLRQAQHKLTFPASVINMPNMKMVKIDPFEQKAGANCDQANTARTWRMMIALLLTISTSGTRPLGLVADLSCPTIIIVLG